jgi:hypothetical protein
MSQIQQLHNQAMDLAEAAFIAKVKGDLEQANQLTRQAFEKEWAAYLTTLEIVYLRLFTCITN